ncbi:energy transducer TonB [Novosphingobium sp. JCM 18896]|uniref:energy transducer TonB n=1 Tax=Novosphingobium sp. JCM 18896 TaxID=2989731 RepID=UPI002221F3B6|nr:energy transducer TonB [Novosphingobium sp. JCM 18896]
MSALASGTVVAFVIYALIMGLAYNVATQGRDALISVFSDQPPPPPPPKPQPKPEQRKAERPAAKEEASPRNLRNKATPVVAPPVVPLIVPPPIVAATQAGTGQAAQTGASDRLGPGRGAGGFGNGTGGGGQGGDGGGGVPAVGPRQIRGKLSFNDLPDGLLAPGSEASVGVRYVVEVDGHVSNCRATESSGYPQIDWTACRLIEQRFRYKPARDREGNPVRSAVVETHSWYIREED